MRFAPTKFLRSALCKGRAPNEFTDMRIFNMVAETPDPLFDAKVQELLEQTVDLVALETKMRLPHVPNVAEVKS
jgi:hypothetical protein